MMPDAEIHDINGGRRNSLSQNSGEDALSISDFSDLVDIRALSKEVDWLSVRKLNEYIESGAIHHFTGTKKMVVVSRTEVLEVIKREMKCGVNKAPSSSAASGSEESEEEKAGPDTGTMTEQEKLHAEASERLLFQKPRKN